MQNLLSLLPRLFVASTFLLPLATSAVETAVKSAPAALASPRDGSHDFDFLYGHWRVHNRRLTQRLAGAQTWVEFAAEDAFHALPMNMGSEENFRSDYWPNFAALGLHLYNPQNGQWTLYWADSRNSPGHIDTLAAGSFDGASGTFFADDTFAGQPIRVRVIWRRIDADHAHWEQAFSNDHEHSWETNWTMDFVRG